TMNRISCLLGRRLTLLTRRTRARQIDMGEETFVHAIDTACAVRHDRLEMPSKRRAPLVATALAGLLLAVTAPVGQASQDSVTGTARHLGADPPFPAIQVHVNAFADATGF